MTREEFERRIRLEGIFMPHSRARRDAYYAGREHARFVHYTSAEAALNIIGSKRIRLRNTTCMSDYSEVQHGFDMLNSFFLDTGRRAQFVTALDECFANAGTDAIALFNQWWNHIRFNTFVASVSEHDDSEDAHGRLSMWRAFGGNGGRVAVVLNVPWFTGAGEELKIQFNPVSYMDREEVHAEVFRVIRNVRENVEFLRSEGRDKLIAYTFMMLATGVTCVKHEGFHEEREWRAIYAPKLATSPMMEQETATVAGIPQTVHNLPLDASVSPAIAGLDFAALFDRLIIGPSQYAGAMAESFMNALVASGVPDAANRIFISGIPIRS